MRAHPCPSDPLNTTDVIRIYPLQVSQVHPQAQHEASGPGFSSLDLARPQTLKPQAGTAHLWPSGQQEIDQLFQPLRLNGFTVQVLSEGCVRSRAAGR